MTAMSYMKIVSCRRVFVLWLLLLGGLSFVVPHAGHAYPHSIKVVMDNNYPPYVFLDSAGKLQGILIDQWRLWEQKTGVGVDIHAMDWDKAIRGMKIGEYDVIDTIFKTGERSNWLDFSEPYARLEVPIFFINDISGITDAASLKGFPVAVKDGDDAVDLLKRNGVENLMVFSSYEAIILAAKARKVSVFVVDAPPGLYFLHKLGIQDQFKRSAPLNVGHFHRAVKKGDREMLTLVKTGFKQIRVDEFNKIDTKWFGSAVGADLVLIRNLSLIAGGLVLVLLTLSVWNRNLRKRVEARTADLKASLKALQTLSLRQEAILSAVPDIIMEVDRDKVYTWVNPAGLEFFGEDVLGKEASYYFEGEQDTYSAIQTLFEGKAKVIYIESWQRRRDGEIRLLAWWCKELKNDHGAIVGAISTARDITERLRMDAELQRMHKLTSVGTLAGGIAHDFNNILMGIFGYISLAKYEIPKDHPGFQPLENAENSMARAVRLTKQLLTFAKGGDPVKEDVSLGALVEEVAKFDLSGSNVMLVHKSLPVLWMVKVDRGQIQQVISNLTINARQAMPHGGHIYITLENVTVQKNDIPNLQPGSYVKISVRDEGGGINVGNLSRIFDPYFTTKQSGHGLGLATAYSIIRKHGGHIGVDSQPGKGATFTVYLPAMEFLNAPKPVDMTGEPHIPKSAIKILFLDDEASIREFVSQWLGRIGYIVETTADGLQAIEMYKQSLNAGEPFDVVILDLTIPGGMGGQDVIKDLLALDPRVRAIVASGYADGTVMANAADYGFKGVIAKPFTERELLDAIGRVLNGT